VDTIARYTQNLFLYIYIKLEKILFHFFYSRISTLRIRSRQRNNLKWSMNKKFLLNWLRINAHRHNTQLMKNGENAIACEREWEDECIFKTSNNNNCSFLFEWGSLVWMKFTQFFFFPYFVLFTSFLLFFFSRIFTIRERMRVVEETIKCVWMWRLQENEELYYRQQLCVFSFMCERQICIKYFSKKLVMILTNLRKLCKRWNFWKKN
jgi:hypothetical protein